MQLFQSTDKLFRIINNNYNLLPVFNRFGIHPGFKDKTVEQVCKEKNINKDFFLALINTYNNPDYFPEEELKSFSPLLIVDYLKKTHAYYLLYFLPKIERLLSKLVSSNIETNSEFKMIVSFFENYKKELIIHIKDEEDNVFPHVINFVQDHQKSNIKNAPTSFEKEHSNVEMKLSDLKNLLIKYLDPVYDNNDFNEFVSSLYQFEKDIIDHARIEDHILVSQIKELKKLT
ncbi:MAG: hypothetical protein DRH21_06180 [Deltaproteobacteria bacterium]|nr:MAG: hypothetical protein DRH21_06180 [Deltaproteobacteria bacterium]